MEFVEIMGFLGVKFAIHNDGLKFVGILAAITVVLMTFSTSCGWIGVLLTLFCAYFFRNPARVVPDDENLITSPADGIVCSISSEVPSPSLELGEDERYKVSIFLSIFDVHVNRVPVSGVVNKVLYHPGAFVNASLDKASVFNEKNTILMTMNDKKESLIAFTQIAGMIARRIVCDIHEGQSVQKGSIFGLIRFGSRCDVWLPVGAVPQVIKGQRMIAGESVISDLNSEQKELRKGIEL